MDDVLGAVYSRWMPFALDRVPAVLRYSNLKRWAEARNGPEAAAAFEKDRLEVGLVCPDHGPLPDPIVCILGGRVAFACPNCSDDAIRLAWEGEGALTPDEVDAAFVRSK